MQAEPNWDRMYVWSRNLAKKLSNSDFWVDELSQAALCRVLEVWKRYRSLDDAEFKKVIGTVMYHEMLAALRDDKSHGMRSELTETISIDAQSVESCQESDSRPRSRDLPSNDDYRVIENSIDAQAVRSAAMRALTPRQLTVHTAVLNSPGQTLAEIATAVGETTEGAVKIHKHNAEKRLKSFFINDINQFHGRPLI